MKKLIFLFTVGTSLLLASCGGGKVENTPEAVTKAFLEKVTKGNFSGAKKYATEESQDALDAMKSAMDMAGSMGKDKKKDSKVEVGKATINGDEATVDATIDGKSKPVKLKKEKGDWKVSFSKADASKDGMNDGMNKSRDAIENIENMGDTLKESMKKMSDTLEKAMKDIKMDN